MLGFLEGIAASLGGAAPAMSLAAPPRGSRLPLARLHAMKANEALQALKTHHNQIQVQAAAAEAELKKDDDLDGPDMSQSMDARIVARRRQRRMRAAQAAALAHRLHRIHVARELMQAATETTHPQAQEQLRKGALRVLGAKLSASRGVVTVHCGNSRPPPRNNSRPSPTQAAPRYSPSGGRINGLGYLPGSGYTGSEFCPQIVTSMPEGIAQALRRAIGQEGVSPGMDPPADIQIPDGASPQLPSQIADQQAHRPAYADDYYRQIPNSVGVTTPAPIARPDHAVITIPAAQRRPSRFRNEPARSNAYPQLPPVARPGMRHQPVTFIDAQGVMAQRDGRHTDSVARHNQDARDRYNANHPDMGHPRRDARREAEGVAGYTQADMGFSPPDAIAADLHGIFEAVVLAAEQAPKRKFHLFSKRVRAYFTKIRHNITKGLLGLALGDLLVPGSGLLVGGLALTGNNPLANALHRIGRKQVDEERQVASDMGAPTDEPRVKRRHAAITNELQHLTPSGGCR